MRSILPSPLPNRATPRFGIVVLAAGASRRLGRPKALVTRQGKTLVQHQVARARTAGAVWIAVAIGCQRGRVENALRQCPVASVVVRRWRLGMGESVAAAARSAPRGLRLIVVATDQWALRPSDLRRLGRIQPRVTAAATYGGVTGIPVSFAAGAVPTLRRLTGDRGARATLAHAMRLPMPMAAPDLDTPADVQHLQRAWPIYRRCPR